MHIWVCLGWPYHFKFFYKFYMVHSWSTVTFFKRFFICLLRINQKTFWCFHWEQKGKIFSICVKEDCFIILKNTSCSNFEVTFWYEFVNKYGNVKLVMCFTKQRYDLFQKTNISGTEGLMIKRLRMRNYDILTRDYTIIITPPLSLLPW